MKFSITSLVFIFAMAVGSSGQAQVYESEDAQGNPVFSDVPTAGAQEVVLPQENIADAVKVAPQPTVEAGTEPAAETNQAAQEHGSVVVIPDSHNEELEQTLNADKPHEVLDAEQRYEVGDQPTPAEIERRKAAREGEYLDEDGNTIRVIHRGHAQ